jgi:hypothetical protein
MTYTVAMKKIAAAGTGTPTALRVALEYIAGPTDEDLAGRPYSGGWAKDYERVARKALGIEDYPYGTYIPGD